MSSYPNSNGLRVAWVFPTLAKSSRWQPIFAEVSKVLPDSIFFAGSWPGFVPGFESSFLVSGLRGVRSITLRPRYSGTASRFFWASPFALRDVVKFRPTLAVTNGFTLLTAYLVLLRFIKRCHLILLWQGISAETGGHPGTLRLLFRRMLARYVDFMISNTKEGADYLQKVVQVPSGKVVHRVFEVADRKLLANGHLQRSVDAGGPHPVFLFVGRLIRGKGVHKLLEASRLLIQRGVDNFSLVLVGEGNHAEEFRRFAREQGLMGHVQWVGPVGYERLGAYYRSCDVFVLPSLEDTWGVVVMEAMTLGKPVLCSTRAGVKEMVEHGVNGFIFDPENPSALADYMEQLIRDPEMRAKFGTASSEIVRAHTPEGVAEMFASYFRQVASCP
jgi:glycosyltransferase involved in cell wall biosynthesis